VTGIATWYQRYLALPEDPEGDEPATQAFFTDLATEADALGLSGETAGNLLVGMALLVPLDSDISMSAYSELLGVVFGMRLKEDNSRKYISYVVVGPWSPDEYEPLPDDGPPDVVDR
jgi:hypothetical protein